MISEYESEPSMCLTRSLGSGGRNAGVMEMACAALAAFQLEYPAYARYRLGADNDSVTD